jgi:hypothetical protein
MDSVKPKAAFSGFLTMIAPPLEKQVKVDILAALMEERGKR